MISGFKGRKPDISRAAFISESAAVIGDVKIGSGSSIWPGAVLRGDVSGIIIGNRTNIQDGAIIHTGYNAPAVIGDGVTVGHGAVLHGCLVRSGSLIGINAVILDSACVERGCLVGACALVPSGTVLEKNGVYMGIPARRVRDVSEAEMKMIAERAREYVKLAEIHAGGNT